MADEEEPDCCPLCMEELDITDKTFDACPCGYQVCLWCWHQIKNEYNGLCPACRTPYAEISKQKNTLDREDVVRRTKQRKQKEKSERRNAAAAAAAAQSSTRQAAVNRKSLANVRVMQRNLVYVIGLPQSFTDEDRLRSGECFGQYGKIVKAVVNKTHLGTDRSNATASAYITFANKEDALACIIAIDNFCLDGSVLRASFGTTKYCNFFLRNLVCNNSDCLYLHELGDQDDSFTKEEMQSALHSGKAAFRESSMVSGSPEVRSGSEFPSAYRPQAAAKIVAGSAASASSARASTPEPVKTEKVRGADASLSLSPPSLPSPPAPAPPSEDARRPNLHVDTSAVRGGSAEETIVGPLEALKLATGSTIQEPAWAQPFPSPAVVHAELDDANPVGGFSHPFNMGFDGGIHRGGLQQDHAPDRAWGGVAAAFSTDSSRDDNDPLGSSNSSSIFAPPPPLPLPGAPPSSALSFASIDAIFSQRTESSEALAGLLGVQLSSTPLAHGSTPQSKSARSSRFAFANQPSGLELPPSPAAPPSPFARMEPPSRQAPGPFGYSASPSPSFPMHHDTSAFPPLGAHHRHAPPPPLPTPSPFGGGGFGSGLSPGDDMMGHGGGMGSGGLAFLQQMLPNVNISFGGDYPSQTSGFPQMGGNSGELGHSESQASAWGGNSLGSLAALDASGEPGFYDPAIVSHSTPLQSGGFFGIGGSLESDGEHRHHHHLLGGGMYRHSGSILNNGN
ncbi:hypothetical protein PybrP1_005804 [[Pythium] brassicae (nom. inval.)]|nr:hypothetical protein PybrP1_005804 [[Pythium] brassicae (nom. inval.)]